ncbi:hypothetical protein C1148_12280 [Clostridium botulinum]|nr:hypothetical protein C1148_12280 [Clostridium botulinum]
MGSVKILNDDDTLTFEAVWINDDGIVIEKEGVFHDFYLYIVKNKFASCKTYVAPFVRQIQVTKDGRGYRKENLIEIVDAINLSKYMRWVISDVFERKELIQKDGKEYLLNK